MVETRKSRTFPHENLEQSPGPPEFKIQTRRTFNKLLAGALLLGCLPPTRGCESTKTPPASSKTQPPGSLVIAGGGELSQEIHDRFITLAGGDSARIVVFPTANADADLPDQNVDMYWPWKDRTVAATMLHTRSRIQANLSDFVRPLTQATGIWFAGGKQHRIADAYIGTLVEQELKNILQRGGVIGGTSAGAAVMSSIMIASGNPIPILRQGFNLLDPLINHPCIIDQHFDMRNRLARLFHALKSHPDHIGIGIGEGAALIVNDSDITVMDKNVWICTSDGKSKEYMPGEKVDLNV